MGRLFLVICFKNYKPRSLEIYTYAQMVENEEEYLSLSPSLKFLFQEGPVNLAEVWFPV